MCRCDDEALVRQIVVATVERNRLVQAISGIGQISLSVDRDDRSTVRIFSVAPVGHCGPCVKPEGLQNRLKKICQREAGPTRAELDMIAQNDIGEAEPLYFVACGVCLDDLCEIFVRKTGEYAQNLGQKGKVRPLFADARELKEICDGLRMLIGKLHLCGTVYERLAGESRRQF